MIDPKDYADKPVGALSAAVRVYDPLWGLSVEFPDEWETIGKFMGIHEDVFLSMARNHKGPKQDLIDDMLQYIFNVENG